MRGLLPLKNSVLKWFLLAAHGTNTSESPSDIPMGLRPAVSTMEKHPCADPTSSQDGKPLLTVRPIPQIMSGSLARGQGEDQSSSV